MLEPDGADRDVVLLEKFPHIGLTEPHGVISDVNLMWGPNWDNVGLESGGIVVRICVHVHGPCDVHFS